MSGSLKQEATEKAQPLTKLRRHERAKIVRIDGQEAQELAGFGLYTGTEIQVKQRFPSYIVQTDEAQLALEPAVARKIFVLRLEQG